MSVRVSIDLRSTLGEVRDQGTRSTCLANAMSTAHESCREDKESLSPEYLHFFASGGVRNVGITFPLASETIEKKGQPLEVDCFSHIDEPPSDWRPLDNLKVFRRLSESKSPHFKEVEKSMRENNVAILGISLPEPFFSPVAPWIISPEGAIKGLHAVTAVGVGEYRGHSHILIRNSWGFGWGDGGHAWIEEGFLKQHLEEILVLTDEVI